MLSKKICEVLRDAGLPQGGLQYYNRLANPTVDILLRECKKLAVALFDDFYRIEMYEFADCAQVGVYTTHDETFYLVDADTLRAALAALWLKLKEKEDG